jgi:predicted secreted protein
MPNVSQVVFGGDAMIFINPTGSTANGAQPAALSTNAKLTTSLGTRQISSKDSVGDFNEYLGTTFDWTMSSDNLMNLSGVTGTTLSTKEVFTAYVAKKLVYVAFSVKTGTSPSWTPTQIKMTGQGLIVGMDFNAPLTDSATYTISIKGSGVLAISG